MSFDEVEFLTAWQEYIEDNAASGVGVYVVKELLPHPDNTLYQLKPPFYVFKDGEAQNTSLDECLIDYTLEMHAYADVIDEMAGPVLGRDAATTGWYGVPHLIKLLEAMLGYDDIHEQISLTNSEILSTKWMSTGPSVNHKPIAGRNWQSKMITLAFQFRVIA